MTAVTASAMATAPPAKALLLSFAPPLTKTGMVVGPAGAGALVEMHVVTTTAGRGAVAILVKTQMDVSGTLVGMQGVMTVRVAPLQVDSGSSQLVQGSVVVQPTVTHSLALQVTVVVHQLQWGRVAGCQGFTDAGLEGGWIGGWGFGIGIGAGAGTGAGLPNGAGTGTGAEGVVLHSQRLQNWQRGM